MHIGRVLVGLVILLVIGAAGFAAYAYRPAIAEIAPPDPKSFDPALVARGTAVAAVGDCISCHTVPGGKTFAGGLAVPTPFGTVYSTNITPDPETGIGRWSEEAFRRALRQGVDREGEHLYPAFPYDHFTLITDEDDRALYAFLMTRQPVKAEAPANQLIFPLNFRVLLAGWNLLFLREGPYRPDPTRDATWNRGAYLVEGAAHCGACHTPRNLLGAEDQGARFAGAAIEGWYAYPIDGASPAPTHWTADTLADFLSEGWARGTGTAQGPMAPVVAGLGAIPADDVKAMASYVASLMGAPASAPAPQASAAKAGQAKPTSADSQVVPVTTGADAGPGATIYASACSSCHDSRLGPPLDAPYLRLSTAPSAPTPTNLINIVLLGIPATEGKPGGIMPNFAGVLSDRQLADLVAYVRSHFSSEPAWTGVDEAIRQARLGAGGLRAYAADGTPSTAVAEEQGSAQP